MGVAYAPFGEDQPDRLIFSPQERIIRRHDITIAGQTECTYLIFFFILGVFLLVFVE